MKIPAYTRDKNVYSANAYKFRSVVKKVEWQKTRSFVQRKYSSVCSYLDWGIQNVPEQFAIGVFMTKLFSNYNCYRILSLGSGDAYMEYSMKRKEPRLQLIITDFDNHLIQNLKKILKGIGTFQVLDIKKDNFERFAGSVDTVFLAATFYVLSDTQAIDFFRRLSFIKPRHIFIIAVAYLWPEDIVKYIFSCYLGGSSIGKLKAHLLGEVLHTKPPGRFHGWTRSLGEFKKILNVDKLFTVQKVYRYKSNFHDQAILYIVPRNSFVPKL